MARIEVGIIMNGVTGRMGTNQHLFRSILAIREQGGVPAGNGDAIWPEPILVGRHAGKLAALAGRCGIERWSTDLDACLGDPAAQVYFDAQVTSARAEATRRAIHGGKHVASALKLGRQRALERWLIEGTQQLWHVRAGAV